MSKLYTIIGLELADVQSLDDSIDNSNKFEKLYTELDEAEIQELTSYMAEWLFDGDQYDQALQSGLERLAARKIVEASK